MKKYLAYISAFVLTASLISPTSKPYAQSTPISNQKIELKEIELYVANSRAILDSLLRYQDTKISLYLKAQQLTALQTQRNDLYAQTIKLRTDANEMAARMFDANTAYEAERKKRIARSIEAWIWRITALTTILLVIPTKGGN